MKNSPINPKKRNYGQLINSFEITFLVQIVLYLTVLLKLLRQNLTYTAKKDQGGRAQG